MTDEIVTRLREKYAGQLPICLEAADEIERLRKELSKWATTPPNRMVCVTHGEMFMCFDEYMGGVYWCEGCRND
jgi:hypothetical protein